MYSGPFVTLGKEEFSNSQNANIQKWSAYVSGSANRQEFLECALDWVSKGNIGDYMSRHRNDKNINELKKYFNSVIDWVSSVFTDVESEMRGLEWGRLYEEYHKKSYNPAKVSAEVQKLYADPYIKNRKGIFEYILGGSVDTKLLEVRVFDEATKKAVYATQTAKAKEKGESNARIVLLGMTPTRVRFGVLAKWTLTMYRLGARAVRLLSKIVRCFVRRTIEQKEIGKESINSGDTIIIDKGTGIKYDVPGIQGVKGQQRIPLRDAILNSNK